ncbi:MAG: glycosyltransferase [Desulfomonilia bacterium]
MNVPVRILHLISTLDVGGAEQNLLRLVSSLDRNLFQNTVISMTSIGATGLKMQELGIRVHAMDLRKGIPDPTGAVLLKTYLKKEMPDVVQCWMYHANVLGLATLRMNRLVWNIRCSDMDLARYGRVYRWTVKLGALLSRLPAAVVINSHAGLTAHTSMGYRPRRWEVIPNGFDSDLFRPDPQVRNAVRAELGIPENALLIGLICRFDPMKDHATFLQAASLMLQRHEETHVLLAGRGVSLNDPHFCSLLSGIHALDHFHFLDERDDIPRLCASLDIACSSSAWGEGLPNAVGEAMSCGVPCVVTNVGDSALLVGDAGIVVEKQNPRELAGAWEKLADSGHDTLRDLGTRARSRIIDHYGIETMKQRYESLYTSLMGGKRP